MEFLNAPEQSKNPIRHLVYILEFYEYSPLYSYHIREILKVLEAVSQTIFFYDLIDEKQSTKNAPQTETAVKELRDHVCERYPIFRPFFLEHVEPFVLRMRKLYLIHMGLYYESRSPNEKYRSMHRQEHLDNVNNLLYKTSQFLRNIERVPDIRIHNQTHDINKVQKSLCTNIAFAIEVSIGLREPLNQLFKEATSLVKKYIYNKTRPFDRWYDLEQRLYKKYKN
jgi:hypothetical protein